MLCLKKKAKNKHGIQLADQEKNVMEFIMVTLAECTGQGACIPEASDLAGH